MASTQFDTLEVRELVVSDKSSFTAATNPIARQAGAAQAAVTVTATTPGTGADASTWTGAQCTAAHVDITALAALVNEVRQCLIDLGLIKGAA